MKIRTIALPLLSIVLPSCADRPLVYVGSQLGAHAQGINDGYPSKLSLGYDRTELTHLPNAPNQPVMGGFDGEIAGLKGIAISEILATGDAASGNSIPTQDCGHQDNTKPFSHSMVVSTNSKFNLGMEMASTDGASPSLNAGFKRSVLAIFPACNQAMPSVYADISVHSSGLRGKIDTPNGIPNGERRLTPANGTRVVQTLAIGPAAVELGKKARQSQGTGANAPNSAGDVKALTKPGETPAAGSVIDQITNSAKMEDAKPN